MLSSLTDFSVNLICHNFVQKNRNANLSGVFSWQTLFQVSCVSRHLISHSTYFLSLYPSAPVKQYWHEKPNENCYPSLLQHVFDTQPPVRQRGSSCLDQIVQNMPCYNLFNPKPDENTSFHQTSSVSTRGNTTAKVDDVSICTGWLDEGVSVLWILIASLQRAMWLI